MNDELIPKLNDSVPQPEYTINPGDIMIKFAAPKDRIVKVADRVTENEKKILELLTEDPGYNDAVV